jgi:hypothetical protein
MPCQFVHNTYLSGVLAESIFSVASILITEATSAFEMMKRTDQSTWRHIAEYINLHGMEIWFVQVN